MDTTLTSTNRPSTIIENEFEEEIVDPLNDIIDYLVRCAKISFKNAHINENEVRTSDKIKMARDLFEKSPLNFLIQFGKHLAPYHVQYFENQNHNNIDEKDAYVKCVSNLKLYHSDESRHKRMRNRRYKALQKLQNESDYFSEKQMMYRNPLLYEQLVGQYLTDEEISDRDGIDSENLTFLSMILETVDRNQMRETKNEQMIEEDLRVEEKSDDDEQENNVQRSKKQWGDFESPDPTPTFTPERRRQTMISAPERRLLREEFLQEMYSSFIEGRDPDVDYHSIDNNEDYDDLQQVSQDAEDRYFDSETNEVINLEEHMKLVQEYGKNKPKDVLDEDPLDEFMEHISLRQDSV